jgi:hypothetical protein
MFGLPEQVICHHCKGIIYQNKDLKSAEDIYNLFNGKCPKCEKELNAVPKEIIVKVAQDSKLRKF